MISTVLYRSVSLLGKCSAEEVDMVRRAQASNATTGITGFLHREVDVYYQWFEGPLEAVEALHRLIVRDPRHKSFELLGQSTVPDRIFPDWSMAYAEGENRSMFDWASQHGVSLRMVQPHEIAMFLLSEATVLAGQGQLRA